MDGGLYRSPVQPLALTFLILGFSVHYFVDFKINDKPLHSKINSEWILVGTENYFAIKIVIS